MLIVFKVRFVRIFLIVQANESELILHLDEANKLAQELTNHKKMLKAAIFGNKLASFHTFPSMGDAPLGELAFTHIQVPFKKLDIASTELKPVDIRVDYDFLLPLEHGERIVAFKRFLERNDYEHCFTQMSSFDRLGRLTASESVRHHVERDQVVQCGHSEFVVRHNLLLHRLSMFDSDLNCVRRVACKPFSNICCNSKFVFGLWSGGSRLYPESNKVDDNVRIAACHVDTLTEAFGLRVPEKYRIERIMGDEDHVVAMTRLDSESLSRQPESRRWFMSVFNLATCKEGGGGGKDAREGQKTRFFLPERHIDLDMQRVWLEDVFLLDGWLFLLHNHNEIFWFDKNGNRSKPNTVLNTRDLRTIYSSRSVLLFAFYEGKLLMRR